MEEQKPLPRIREDFSCYTWYKGEIKNPYERDSFHPLATTLWNKEKDFHAKFIKDEIKLPLEAVYLSWKKQFIEEQLPSLNPFGEGRIDWERVYETGKRQELE